METQNKCYFSIKLGCEITITGNNPSEVREFLRNIHIATMYADENKNLQLTSRTYTKERINILEDQILEAIVTINENYHKKGV